jgi:hypothetical protein
MSKHTPGPWKADKQRGTRCIVILAPNDIAKGYGIAVVTQRDPHPSTPNVGIDDKTTKANADLISAAPELLDLARLILKEWEAPTEGVQRGELIARLSQYAKEAREAIAKAEGKS